jgi:hypothetical protein
VPSSAAVKVAVVVAAIGFVLGVSSCKQESQQPAHGVPNIVGMGERQGVTLLHQKGLAWRWGGSRRVIRELPPCWRDDQCLLPGADERQIETQSPPPGSVITAKTVVVIEDECTLLRFEHSGERCFD